MSSCSSFCPFFLHWMCRPIETFPSFLPSFLPFLFLLHLLVSSASNHKSCSKEIALNELGVEVPPFVLSSKLQWPECKGELQGVHKVVSATDLQAGGHRYSVGGHR